MFVVKSIFIQINSQIHGSINCRQSRQLEVKFEGTGRNFRSSWRPGNSIFVKQLRHKIYFSRHFNKMQITTWNWRSASSCTRGCSPSWLRSCSNFSMKRKLKCWESVMSVRLKHSHRVQEHTLVKHLVIPVKYHAHHISWPSRLREKHQCLSQ